MVAPDPAVAPVIPPVIGPTVQINVLGTLDVRFILGLPPLHVFAVGAFVTVTAGSTLTVMV